MIGVVIATYGDRDHWAPMVRRASDSVDAQTVPAYAKTWSHRDTLQQARNIGVMKMVSESDIGLTDLVFLDADDELDPGYLEAMTAAAASWTGNWPPGRYGLFRPNTIGVYPDGSTDDAPCMIERSDMRDRNCAVIGTMVPLDVFIGVGGFDDYPCLEDWALWRKALRAGAELVDVPDAIYRVHVNDGSRNAPSKVMNETYRRIRREIPL